MTTNILEVNRPITVSSGTYLIKEILEFSDPFLGMRYEFKFTEEYFVNGIIPGGIRKEIRKLLLLDLNFSHLAVVGILNNGIIFYTPNSLFFELNKQFTEEFDPYYRWSMGY